MEKFFFPQTPFRIDVVNSTDTKLDIAHRKTSLIKPPSQFWCSLPSYKWILVIRLKPLPLKQTVNRLLKISFELLCVFVVCFVVFSTLPCNGIMSLFSPGQMACALQWCECEMRTQFVHNTNSKINMQIFRVPKIVFYIVARVLSITHFHLNVCVFLSLSAHLLSWAVILRKWNVLDVPYPMHRPNRTKTTTRTHILLRLFLCYCPPS